MSQLYFIAIGILLAIAAGVGYWYFRRSRQAHAVAAIFNDPNPLATWTYTADEWRQAVADEFSWGRVDRDPAQVRICLSGVYVGSGSTARVLELETGDKVVTFAGYLGTEGSPLKLRVRWRTVTYDQNGYKQTKYYKEDHRIPVPSREKESALRVVDFFYWRLENNPAAYTEVVPDDEPISLFGKDSF
jgi:hypothetical protein